MSDEKITPELEELTNNLVAEVSAFRVKYDKIKSIMSAFRVTIQELKKHRIENEPTIKRLEEELQNFSSIIYSEVEDEKGVEVKDLFVDAAVRLNPTPFTQSFTRNPNNQTIPDRTAWYFDQVINLLNQLNKHNNPNTPVNYENATYPALVLNSHADPEQPPINLAQNNGITIIPLNVSDSLRKADNIWEQGGAHWVSLIINHNTKTIYYYDPKYPDLKFGNDQMDFMQFIKAFGLGNIAVNDFFDLAMQECGDNKINFIKFIKALGLGTYNVQTILPKIQQNDYDCGPIAIEVSQHILHKGDVNVEILTEITNKLQNGGIQKKAEELRIEDIKKLLAYFHGANKSLDLIPAPNAIPTPNRGQAAPAVVPLKIATTAPRAMDSAAVNAPNSFLSNITTFLEMLYNRFILPIINALYPSINIPQATVPVLEETNVRTAEPDPAAIKKDGNSPTSKVSMRAVTPKGRAG